MTPQEQYDKAIQKATQGEKIDIEKLRIELGIKFEQSKPEIKLNEMQDPSLKANCEYKEKIRYGNQN